LNNTLDDVASRSCGSRYSPIADLSIAFVGSTVPNACPHGGERNKPTGRKRGRCRAAPERKGEKSADFQNHNTAAIAESRSDTFFHKINRRSETKIRPQIRQQLNGNFRMIS
jgi:hypothetical protein